MLKIKALNTSCPQVAIRNEIHQRRRDGEIDYSEVSHDPASLRGERASAPALRGSLHCHYHRWEPQWVREMR